MSVLSKLMAAVATAGMMAGAAHAVTIVPIANGPFSLPGNPSGIIPAGELVTGGNTYDFTFTTVGGTYKTLMQMQASKVRNGTAQTVAFDLYSGTPLGAHSFIAHSGGTATAATLLTLTAGTYYMQYSPSISPTELATGGVTLLQTVPEPAAWALMLVGVGALGAAMRRRRLTATATA
jgi:hypothetical protein